MSESEPGIMFVADMIINYVIIKWRKNDTENEQKISRFIFVLSILVVFEVSCVYGVT